VGRYIEIYISVDTSVVAIDSMAQPNNVAHVEAVLTTAREQRELFCWKFPEVSRDDVTQLMAVSDDVLMNEFLNCFC